MGRLAGMRRADAAIVGGGLTGFLLASALSQEGMRVAVIDAGDGTPSVSNALAAALCVPVYARIEAAHGLEQARMYFAALQSQLMTLADAPLPYVRNTPVFVYAETPEDLPALERQQELLMRLGVPASIAPDAGGCPFPVELSLMAHGQALVNLPRWTSALQSQINRRDGRIFTGSRVIAIDGTRVCTAQGCVDASHVILTTGKPLGLRSRRLLPLLETHLLAHCELTGPVPLHSCQLAVQENGLTLAPTATGITVTWDAGRLGARQQSARLAHFEHLLNAHLPDFQRGEMQYSQPVSSADGLPVIGILPGTRLLCASGFSGVLGAMHAAQVLTQRILGRALPDDAIYAPDRPIPPGILRPQIRRMAGIYAGNMLRRSAPPCAHCGCRMRYSTAVQRWECPYCGSAYTMLGTPLCAPAMTSARVSVRQRPDL